LFLDDTDSIKPTHENNINLIQIRISMLPKVM